MVHQLEHATQTILLHEESPPRYSLELHAPGASRQVDLPDGLMSPLGARRAAVQLGYCPTHWRRAEEPQECVPFR